MKTTVTPLIAVPTVMVDYAVIVLPYVPCISMSSRCDNEFFFCVRELEAELLSASFVMITTGVDSLVNRASALGCLQPPPALRSMTDTNAMFSDFAGSMFLGLPNPLEFLINSTRWGGQLKWKGFGNYLSCLFPSRAYSSMLM